VTKIGRADGSFTNEEKLKQYWYHSDHLGSAQLITNIEGEEYERIEYTPYGELWVERTSAASNIDIPYRFTGKERDKETGLYYYGARYLDPKFSRWLSPDPALSDYIPGAPVNDEVKKRNSELPGMGGVFNTVNLHLYHYAGNNPVKYTDPTGMWVDNEDGTYTAEEGDTLWGLAEQETGNGSNWESFGYEGDPTKLQIGQVIGQKNEISEPVVPDNIGISQEINVPQKKEPNLFLQGLVGAGEILAGGGIWVGVTFGGIAAEAGSGGTLTPAVGYGMLSGYSFGGVLIADGINLLSNAFAGKEAKSITFSILQAVIPDSMLDVGKGLNEYRQNEGR
jgi:RHS repeat-associated protein